MISRSEHASFSPFKLQKYFFIEIILRADILRLISRHKPILLEVNVIALPPQQRRIQILLVIRNNVATIWYHGHHCRTDASTMRINIILEIFTSAALLRGDYILIYENWKKRRLFYDALPPLGPLRMQRNLLLSRYTENFKRWRFWAHLSKKYAHFHLWWWLLLPKYDMLIWHD